LSRNDLQAKRTVFCKHHICSDSRLYLLYFWPIRDFPAWGRKYCMKVNAMPVEITPERISNPHHWLFWTAECTTLISDRD
jgi:hypothetical protein